MDKPKPTEEAAKVRRLDLSRATYSNFLSAPKSAPAWIKKLGDSNRFKSRSSTSGAHVTDTEDNTSSPVSPNTSLQDETSPSSLHSFNQSENISPLEDDRGNLQDAEGKIFSTMATSPNPIQATDAAFLAANKSAERDTSSGWVELKTPESSSKGKIATIEKALASGRLSLSITSPAPFSKLGKNFLARKFTSYKPRRISVSKIGQPLTSRHVYHTSDPDKAGDMLKTWNDQVTGKLAAFENGETSQKGMGAQVGQGSGVEDAHPSALNRQTCEFTQNLSGSSMLPPEPEGSSPDLNFNQTVIVRKQSPRKRMTLDFSGLSTPIGSTSEKSQLSKSMGKLSESLEGITEEKPEVVCAPSFITVEKTVATKVFFEKHYDAILKRPKDRDQRQKLMEDELLRLNVNDNERKDIMSNWNRSETAYLREIRSRVGIENFNKLKTIGHGAFGVVSLVREEVTGELLAMKQMRKSDMLRRGQEGHIRAERDLMTAASSTCRWIVRLVYSFQDVDHLYLVMEYMGGGDMLNLLIQRDTFPESMAKFYVAEMILAIEEAHKLGYIHRDIKPDNFLFDREGHVKLSDFGLATDFHWAHDAAYYEHQRIALLRKHGIDLEDGLPNLKRLDQAYSLEEDSNGADLGANGSKGDRLLTIRDRKRKKMAYSVVGTNNYMAPEVLKSGGYDRACDWWSLGVILFEMIFGYPPFSSRSRQITRTKIMQWKSYLRFPTSPRISQQGTHFMQSLLCDRKDRLGTSARPALAQRNPQRNSTPKWLNLEPSIQREGADQLKAHPWFEGINFQTIHLEKPPFIPKLKSETDTRYFEDDIDANPLPLPGGPGVKPQTRDLLLGHSEHGADILETRKKHAFVGYTFKSPRREFFDPRRGFLLQDFNSSGTPDEPSAQTHAEVVALPVGPSDLDIQTEGYIRRMSM
ncbi:hypothetical protein MJO28_010730 [Puccinia striiformis f. sp. tritici]|uniref:Uncharacterized protein n=1 Tax=Puccinia striiformis f. sp. tritici TaxID=168172 RepID=A0ACC0E5T7_9BASI|nr:hypothetical protein MJO28_010730 [Puccinia striiformis f. sp. tritici]KAI7948809.1 hypothetical protein MJO29_010474 [Puccinia striiformis f. sp. tritici]